MATISEQIASIDAQIANKNARIAGLLQSARDWRASKSQCAGLKKTRTACENGKEQEAVLRETNANAIRSEIAELQRSKQSLLESQKTENTIGIKLADQGISQASAIIKAEGEAKAAIQSAQIKSTAEADAINKNADANSMQKTVIVGFVGLAILVLAVVLIKKYAGKNKVKSKQ